MESILYILMIGAWIWSIIRGIQVSLLCAILNFFFPPLSQVIFAIYEERLRAPLLFIVVSGGLLIYLYGEVAFEGAVEP